MAVNIPKSSIASAIVSSSLVNSFLLLENGGYILQENNSKIILEQSTLLPFFPSGIPKSSITSSIVIKS